MNNTNTLWVIQQKHTHSLFYFIRGGDPRELLSSAEDGGLDNFLPHDEEFSHDEYFIYEVEGGHLPSWIDPETEPIILPDVKPVESV